MFSDWQVALRQLGRLEEAAADLEALLALDGHQHAMAHFQRGYLFMVHRRNKRALRHFTSALHLRPDHKAALQCRGYVRFLLGDLKHAQEDFSRIVRAVDRADPAALAARGLVRHRAGATADAARDLGHAVRADPRCGLAYLFRAALRQDLGDEQEALDDFHRAIPLLEVSAKRARGAMPWLYGKAAEERAAAARAAGVQTGHRGGMGDVVGGGGPGGGKDGKDADGNETKKDAGEKPKKRKSKVRVRFVFGFCLVCFRPCISGPKPNRTSPASD